MKIQSIRLHPFAGIIDKTYSFNNSLTIIFGPNEEGKSTIAKAIQKVLFLETNLTPTKKRDNINDFMPLTGSDTISITLKFSYNLLEYTLEKTWGASSSVRLTSSDGVVFSDSTSVQEQIQNMLPANQAVVEQILIASQSKLADAVNNLSNDVQISLSEQLRSTILKGGGINGTLLEQNINKEVINYFGRWDDTTSKPEGGASRESLTNRWSSGAGKVVKAWYDLKQAITIENDVEYYEKENNRLQEEINLCNENIKPLNAFLKLQKSAYDAVNQRILIEGNIVQFQMALNQFAKDAERWPFANADYNVEKKTLEDVKKDQDNINQELLQARKKQDFLKDLENFRQINELINKIKENEKIASTLVQIPESELSHVSKLRQDILNCQALIDGQKLRMNIIPSINGDINIVHSAGHSETIKLTSGQKIEKEISGRVSFEWQGINFHIQSANADILTLEQSLKSAQNDLLVLLQKYNQTSIDSLIKEASQNNDVQTQIKLLNSNLKLLLGKDTYETLKLRCDEATSLPGTRDIKILDELYERKSQELGKHKANLNTLSKEIEELILNHVSFENLDNRRLNVKKAIEEKQKILESLPPIPVEFDSSILFQSKYNEVINEERKLSDQKNEFEIQIHSLNEPTLSLRDAKEQTQHASSKYKKTLEEGIAFRRIQHVLKTILVSADINAFQPLHSKTEYYLKKLSSGRFESIPFDVTKPQQLVTDGVSIPVSLLSKGTKDILALALRLAAAEVYLENKSGFVIMDDPLVDMDRKRREVSSEVLREFAAKFPTIIFTCHENHFELFTKK